MEFRVVRSYYSTLVDTCTVYAAADAEYMNKYNLCVPLKPTHTQKRIELKSKNVLEIKK